MADDLILLQTPASPFARKVRIAALLRDVPLRLEKAPVNPVERNETLAKDNPLAKIPVLITPDGRLYDSRVICRYVDMLGDGPGLYDGEAPWEILRLEALADGIMDAAVNLRYETTSRPEALRWPSWIDAQTDRIIAALDMLEDGTQAFVSLHAGTIAVAAALEYLDFRHPDLRWRIGHPALCAWLKQTASTDWMRDTAYTT